MDHRRLGNTGLFVSEVGLGCNNFGMRIDYPATAAVVFAAIDAGINFFDTADIYGATKSETMLGQAIEGKRHDLVIATKFGGPTGKGVLHKGGSRRHVIAACEASLKRLNTDYIDLYQMHFPDVDSPIEETLRALDDLVRSGKVRYLGSSNFSGWQIADADWLARSSGLHRFVTAQNQFSLLERRVEKEVIPACARFGLSLLPYFPLASGVLTGKYKRNAPAPEGSRLANPATASSPMGKRALSDRNFDRVEKLSEFAQARGKSILDLAFAWLLANPVLGSVIAGATKPEQVQANALAAAWKLSNDEVSAVNGMLDEQRGSA